jgi:hypothetical protein
MYFCSALVECGASVELVALGIRLADDEAHRPTDPHDLYETRKAFPVRIARTPLHQDSSAWAVGLVRLWVHTAAVVARVRRLPAGERLVVYSRNFLLR